MEHLFNKFIGKKNEKNDPIGSLILKTAYKAGDIRWINYFISKGAKLKGRSDGFEEACRSNNVEVLEHWIKNGGVVPKNPEYECVNNVCLLGNFDMVKLLVESGVDLSDPERNGARIAYRLGLKRTLKYLLDNNAVVGNICRYQLERVYLIEDIGLLKLILEYYDSLGVLERKNKTDTNKGEEPQIINNLDKLNADHVKKYKITKTLLEKDDIETLQLVLTRFPDIDGASYLLGSAIRSNKLEAAKLLLKDTTTLENSEYNYVYEACKNNNMDILMLLFEKGENVEIGDGNEVIQVCENNNLEMLKNLLERNPNLVLNQDYGLKEAIYHKNVETIKLLIDHGADDSEHRESI
ncbi:putative ankyrin repeat protein L63 [Zancudomyces culisetae]|uniref:Putative ankyrin repeat protein L63 n=1 Tax=Zancudomyces culisetae TaxID=1213189 RepID=A0A1R1PCC7_ZANCU|nr:putative ankyrin repeat protein L63 [Zancudomyces culisetae]OMH84370.1 putative ankyrin repeat protein L63 [Zancudomyces culisetae]|eukprot:OMH78626.1 putative ankyrin repeat protein L63 [Zancudomyces culisetae]